MKDEYHELIKALITEKGALGVNALQRELGLPISTLQRYLHNKQSYFKMNSSRKWDLPENVFDVAIDNFDSVITSQLSGITSLSDMLITQIKSTIVLLSSQRAPSPAVAEVQPKNVYNDKRLQLIEENTQKLKEIFKKNMSNVPKIYKELLLNYDHIGLIIKKGDSYALSFLEGDIFSMLSGNAQELSEETLQTLKDNQL